MVFCSPFQNSLPSLTARAPGALSQQTDLPSPFRCERGRRSQTSVSPTHRYPRRGYTRLRSSGPFGWWSPPRVIETTKHPRAYPRQSGPRIAESGSSALSRASMHKGDKLKRQSFLFMKNKLLDVLIAGVFITYHNFSETRKVQHSIIRALST